MGLFGKSSKGYPILKQVSFLSPLNGHERGLFAQYLDRRVYQPGEYVFRQNYPAAVLYIVSSGELEILLEKEDHEPVVLDKLIPGRYFGEVGLFQEMHRTACVRAVVESELLAISQQDFLNIMNLSPRTGAKILLELNKRLSDMVVRTNERLREQGNAQP